MTLEIQVTPPPVNTIQVIAGQSVPQTVAYAHTQNVTSASWLINHNLGFKPNVTVVDSAGTIVEGEITYTNTNSLTVHFTNAFSGHAYLS